MRERLRKANPEEYKKRQNAKKRRKMRISSRDKRNAIRHGIRLVREAEGIRVILISKETENAEKLYLERIMIKEDSYLLRVPMVTYKELIEYMRLKKGKQGLDEDLLEQLTEELLRDYINEHMNFELDRIEYVDGMNMLVCYQSKQLKDNSNYLELISRIYNVIEWSREFCTTDKGVKIYTGKQLLDFFLTVPKISTTFVSQETITLILLYRIFSRKLDSSMALNDICSYGYRRGVYTGLYDRFDIMLSYESFYTSILAHEEEEMQTLMNPDFSGIIRDKGNAISGDSVIPNVKRLGIYGVKN